MIFAISAPFVCVEWNLLDSIRSHQAPGSLLQHEALFDELIEIKKYFNLHSFSVLLLFRGKFGTLF